MVLLQLSPTRPVDDSVASTVHGRMSQSFATEVAAMAERLARSEALSYRDADGSSPRRKSNFAILRSGVHAVPLSRMMLARPLAAKAAREASSLIASGEVIAEMSAEDVDNIPMWQQGDALLATEEKMAQRQRLRYDRRVLAVLQMFWEAAQRSLQAKGDVDADTLHREGHAMVPCP